MIMPNLLRRRMTSGAVNLRAKRTVSDVLAEAAYPADVDIVNEAVEILPAGIYLNTAP